jgi:sec-independent protein translocase protein TatB
LFAKSPISFERRFLMFDFDAGKLIIVGIVALIVIGPKELPRVMLQVGQAAAKMRRMAAEFRSQFMDAMREAEIDDIKSDVEKLTESAKADTGMNPLAQMTAELTQAIDSAEKPAMLPSASTRTAIAGPNNAEPLLNSIAGPCLPEGPEDASPCRRPLLMGDVRRRADFVGGHT